MAVAHTSPGPAASTFLPLTLSAIRAAGEDALASHAISAERAAADSWQALLGDCACAHRWVLPDRLRLLSAAAGEYAAGEWWRPHGARVAEFEQWVADAIDEGDGEDFAEACAGYDAALARALVAASGRPAGLPSAAGAPSGTMTE